MRAAVLAAPRTIEIQTWDVPTPGKDEALVRVKAVGLCGSDVHYYEHGRIGDYIVRYPMILGHEAAGEVVAVGEEVQNLTVGQRVTIEPGVTCGRCTYCKSGRYNLCPQVEFLATPPFDGAFCEYIAIRADFLYPIPDSLSDEKAALIEPFSVGLHAVRRGHLVPGETVVIMGMGPIGMLALAAAKASGASRVIGVDMEPFRLEIALKMGATHVIDASKEDAVAAVNRILGNQGADLAIETAGNGQAVRNAIGSVRRGGRVVLVGLPPQSETAVDIGHIVDGEIDIYGVFRYHNTYAAAVEMLSGDQIDLTPIITDDLPLESAAVAFEKAIHEKNRTLKIVIRP